MSGLSGRQRAWLRVRALASKEVKHILRDRQLMGFALVMPVLLLLLFGYAVSFDVDRSPGIPLGVVDQDHSARSRGLVDRFDQTDLFHIALRSDDPEVVEPLFRRDIARAVLVIPKGFSDALARGEPGRAQILIDGTDNTTASAVLGYTWAVALSAIPRVDLLGRPVTAPPLIEARTVTLFNPRRESAIFLVPGLMALVLVLGAVMLTALGVAREYERGSMELLFSTPVGRLEIIVGKLGPNFVLGLLQVLLVLAVAVTLFEVPIRGSVILVFFICAVFILAMLMQGLVISVLTRNQMVASQVAAMTSLLPSLLLSGFIFPIENLPVALQVFSAIFPARYLIEALRAVMLRGNGLEAVWVPLIAMLAFFLVMLAVATRRFQRRLA